MVEGYSEKGSYSEERDISKLSPGVYACKMLIDNNELIVKKLVISR